MKLLAGLWVLFFLFSSSASVSQDLVYETKTRFEFISLDEGDSFEYSTGVFVTEESVCTDGVGEGVYHFRNDSLILNFTDDGKGREAKKKITPIDWEEKEGKRKLNIKVRSFKNGKKDTVPFANIIIKGESGEKKLHKGYTCSVDGSKSFLIDDDFDEIELHIDAAHYFSLETNVKLKKSAEIELFLEKDPLNDKIEGRKMVFEILEESKDSIKLRKIKKGEANNRVKTFSKE